MGKSYLDAEDLRIGNLWLKTIFFPCVKDSLNPDYINYRTYSRSRVIDACKRIYSFVTETMWDVNNDLENTVFRYLTKGSMGAVYKIDPNGGDEESNTYTLNTSKLCRIIANLCQKTETFWDDTQHTPEELRYFISTPMGKALWDFRCFVTQEPDILKVATPKASGAPRAPRASGGSASSGSKLNLQNAGGLVTGQKELLNGTHVYWIRGEFKPQGKTRPRIHVSPCNQAAPLKVKYGSGQGFDDCVLCFDDYNTAVTFLEKVKQNAPSNVDVDTLTLKAWKVDSNGYFKVNTEFGEAYIEASKLHEALNKLEEERENNKKEILEEIARAYEALQNFMN